MATRHGVDIKVTQLLLQVGLMCGELGRFEEAVRIIRTVKNFRDDIAQPGAALGFIYLRHGRLPEAEQELEATLAAHPDHQLAKALLGWVRREAGRPDWFEPLQQVIADGREEWPTGLARRVLGVAAPAPETPYGAQIQDLVARIERLYG